jgi:hypothetical protein
MQDNSKTHDKSQDQNSEKSSAASASRMAMKFVPRSYRVGPSHFSVRWKPDGSIVYARCMPHAPDMRNIKACSSPSRNISLV